MQRLPALSRLPAVLATLAAMVGCGRSSDGYAVTGQVVSVATERAEITLAHDDIPGYMPAMTMPFKVADRALLDGVTPGDVVRGRLVVSATDGYLRELATTGRRELPSTAPAAPVHAGVDYYVEGDRIDDQGFVDHDGRPLRLHKLGGAVALTFIYTRCPFPTFCPLIDRQFQAVHARLKADPDDAGSSTLLSITIDPAFDTTAVLAAHAAGLGADDATWRFVNATESAPGAFAARFGVVADAPTSEQAALVHNLVTVVVGKDMRIRSIYRGNDWTVDELLGALRADAP